MRCPLVPAAASALTLTVTLTLTLSEKAAMPLFDFSNQDTVRSFRVINDGVMGGVSTSGLRLTAEAMIFEGEVSLANNGGFASCRGPVTFRAGSATLLLTVRGDGQRYKLTLRRDDSPGAAQYQAVFTAPRDWQTLRFVPSDFAASFRGRPVTAPILRFEDMQQLGVLISDRQAGAFRVELKTIEAE